MPPHTIPPMSKLSTLMSDYTMSSVIKWNKAKTTTNTAQHILLHVFLSLHLTTSSVTCQTVIQNILLQYYTCKQIQLQHILVSCLQLLYLCSRIFCDHHLRHLPCQLHLGSCDIRTKHIFV